MFSFINMNHTNNNICYHMDITEDTPEGNILFILSIKTEIIRLKYGLY